MIHPDLFLVKMVIGTLITQDSEIDLQVVASIKILQSDWQTVTYPFHYPEPIIITFIVY